MCPPPIYSEPVLVDLYGLGMVLSMISILTARPHNGSSQLCRFDILKLLDTNVL